MKKSLITIVSIILLLSFVSCSGGEFTDSKGATEIATAISSAITTDGGTKTLDSDAILEISDDKISYLKDFVMVKAKNAKNINEYGIFRVENGKAEEMKALVSAYVENLQKIYRAMDYFPEEVEKIDFATVKVFGNYVVYSFLNESDTDAFHSAIKAEISK